jgi:GAF domain-containing protein
MKFLRDKQLRHLGAYVVLLTLFVFVVQFFIVDNRINALEEAEFKIEYTQVAQLGNQKISLQVQHYLNGDRSLPPTIAAQIEEQEFHLKTLSNGGRIGQRDEFIGPLKRLPRITFEGLVENWQAYKQSVFQLITDQDSSTTPSVTEDTAQDSSATLSSDPLPVLVKTTTGTARLQYEALSLRMSSWYDKLMLDLDEEVQQRKTGLARWKISMLIFNMVLVTGIYFLFQKSVLAPLGTLENNIGQHIQSQNLPQNELGSLARTVNETIENLKDATDFVVAIGKGDLNLDYKESLDKNYIPGKNKLADSLIEMQAKLRQLNDEEQQRQWSNEGLAKFVEILRTSNDDITTLGDRIISGLIHYTRSNQGALYILNDEDASNPCLELISLFAWDIKKHEQQKIRPGQGILGQTYLEKETTHLTSLPEEYIRITSGLGGASPKSVLIVPLKVDLDVYGLVELASFEEFKPHEIAFVEKIGENIASTLASVRAAQRNRLLIEQFREQTEEMRAQEEEMRQNMEEMQATQEEVARKERSYVSRIAELEKTLAMRGDVNEAAKIRDEAKEKEAKLLTIIEGLEKDLSAAKAKPDDWQIAAELNKTLRAQIEGLRITGEELDRARQGK